MRNMLASYIHNNVLLCLHHQKFHCTHAGLPTQEERLILALGLGGSGNDYRPVTPGGGPLLALAKSFPALAPAKSFPALAPAMSFPALAPAKSFQASAQCPQPRSICQDLSGIGLAMTVVTLHHFSHRKKKTIC